ncbi:hypothetical protein LUZ63_006245 [Rhynchospora breviuscula]|uniref:Anaphase-promoting complex subunit 13 n=1 Tax=Rhynchospora breviuscula TaxID=2022672 RepID=A0A9Q0CPF1_9POAL|nr:hypothetical protein LUZ63_006245 [Rhynchospora breviuscula]
MAELQQLSMGVLIDLVDEDWMRDTLPLDDLPLPSAMAPKSEENEETSSMPLFLPLFPLIFVIKLTFRSDMIAG